MSDEPDDIDAPDLVQWSPRHGAMIGGPSSPRAWPLTATGAAALGAVSLGALALGAVAIGALVIGRVAVGRARLRDVRFGRLEIGDLVVLRRNGRPF